MPVRCPLGQPISHRALWSAAVRGYPADRAARRSMKGSPWPYGRASKPRCVDSPTERWICAVGNPWEAMHAHRCSRPARRDGRVAFAWISRLRPDGPLRRLCFRSPVAAARMRSLDHPKIRRRPFHRPDRKGCPRLQAGKTLFAPFVPSSHAADRGGATSGGAAFPGRARLAACRPPDCESHRRQDGERLTSAAS